MGDIGIKASTDGLFCESNIVDKASGSEVFTESHGTARDPPGSVNLGPNLDVLAIQVPLPHLEIDKHSDAAIVFGV
eukprot:scaffold42401_cov145-Amphora_coffeaeformis.AAC.1